MTYPEHEKLQKVQGNSQAIGEFIDWLRYEKHIYLAESSGPNGGLYHQHVSDQDLLAEFYRIDRKALEEEKRAMLRTIREAAS